MTYKAL